MLVYFSVKFILTATLPPLQSKIMDTEYVAKNVAVKPVGGTIKEKQEGHGIKENESQKTPSRLRRNNFRNN